MSTHQPDTAADWLASGRYAGLTATGRRQVNDRLARIADRVLDGARLHPGDHVVDVGAGTGLLTSRALATVGATGIVTAVDRSAEALRQIEEPAGGGLLRRITADVVAMPLGTGSADVAVARSVLIYLEDLHAALAEIRRVLRPGGRLSVFEPVNAQRRHDARLPGLTPAHLDSIRQALDSATPAAVTMTRFSEDLFREAALAAGFDEITVDRDQAEQVMAGRDAVMAHLTRVPHPGAASPLDTISRTLGEDLARQYALAWEQAVDTQQTIVYVTPTVFVTATATAQRT